MGRKLLVLAIFVSGGLPLAWAPATARTQDWEVKRDPFDPQLVARYKAILAQNPTDAEALRKLVALYKKHRTLKLLIEQLEAGNFNKFAKSFVLGRLYEWENKPDQAIAMYAAAEAERPADPLIPSLIGALQNKAGKRPEARAAYERALAGSKSSTDKKKTLKVLANLAADLNDGDAVEKYAKEYSAIDPKDAQARLDFADILVRLKRIPRALELYKEAEGLLGADPSLKLEVLSRLGAAQEAANDDDGALKTYRRAIEQTDRENYVRRELTGRVVEIYRRKRQLPQLITELEKQWKPASRNHFEWDLLARLYEETGNQDQAIAAFRSATKKAPNELDTQRRLITLLENSGRDAEALKQYEDVVHLAPGEPRFQLDLAQKYWRAGEQKKAFAILSRLESRFRSDAGIYSALADLYTRWGREDLALKAYVQLTKIEPNEVSHLVNLGEQYFQRDDRKRAMAIWNRIVAQPTADNHARLAQVFAEHDLLSEALITYSKAIKLDPKKEAFYRGRAVVYERQKQNKEAIDDWEHAMALFTDQEIDKPRVREARQRIVNLLQRSGGTFLAQRVNGWRRDFEKKPPLVSAGYFLVEAYLRMNQLEEARKVLEALLKSQGDDIDAMHALVNVYKSERNYDKAIETLTRLAEKSPGREREYYTQIAELKTILHEDADAIEYAKKALEKDPNDPLVHQRLAERYESMQQYAEAISAYEKALEHDPRKFDAYFALARLYRNQDQHDKAAGVYHKLLNRASDEDVLYKAGREAISLEELTNTLPELEKVLAPLCFSLPHKKVYRRLLVELYARYVPDLVARLRRGEEENPAALAKELDRLGSGGLKPLLEALNDDKDPAQQRMAVQVLGYLGNEGAAGSLVKIAREDPPPPKANEPMRVTAILPGLDWDVRVEALVAAGRLGDPRVVPDLIVLAHHREASMREAAVFGLGMTRERKAIAPLSRAVDDPVEGVQVLACLGLGRIGTQGEANKEVSRRLASVVQDGDRPDQTRAACAFALGIAGDPSQSDVLIETLGQGNDETQRASAWALGRLGQPKAIPALFRAYFAQGERVREAAAWALLRVNLGSAPSQPTAVSASDLPDYPMVHGKFDPRSALDQVLGRLAAESLPTRSILGQEDVVKDSIRAALDKHRDITVRLLEELDGSADTISLGTPSESPAELTRELIALRKIGEALEPSLIALLEHRDPVVRRLSLSLLAKTSKGSIAPAIRRALTDTTAPVRAQAMVSAAVFVRRAGADADRLVDLVLKALGQEPWQDRVAAAKALGQFGKSGVGALTTALGHDENSFVREAAAQSLGTISASAGAPALERAANHTHEPIADVRMAALRALINVSPSAAGEVLSLVAKNDPSAQVRTLARELGSAKKH